MTVCRFLLLICTLLPVPVLANSAPEKGAPSQFQPTTANPVPDPPTCPTGRCPEPVDPVVLSGGKLYYPIVDVTIPGRGRASELNLRFFRAYSSQDDSVGVLGRGWTTTLDIYLGNAGGSTPYFRSDTGNQMFFTQGTITFHDGHVGSGWHDQGWTLEAVSGGDYEMCEKFGWKYRFTSTGQLRYIEDPLGHRLTYNRNGLGRVTSITDASNRSLIFTYDNSSKLTSMTDPLGRVWGFGYFPSGVWGANMLAEVKGPAPLNLIERYYYSADGNMLSVKNPRGNVTSYLYDAAMDRVTRMTHPNGQFVQFAYNNYLGVSAMTDEDGKVWQYEYAGPGLVTNIIDPLNAVHHYQYNSSHELTEYRGPLYDPVNAPDRKITYTWNNHNLTRIVDETGTIKDFTYHATNHEITAEEISVENNLRIYTVEKDNLRRLEEAIDGEGESALYDYYSTTGLLKTVTDRRGKVTTLQYDAHGNLEFVVDANNQPWAMTYDAAGRLITRTSPIAGTTVTYTYDVADRITRITDAAGKFWDFTYDGMGNLLTEKTPLASTTTTYTYDSRDRRITAKDPLNNTTTYAYNGRNLLTSITDPASRVTSFKADNASRPTDLTWYTAVPSLITNQSLTWNGVGNITSIATTNGLSGTRNYSYDQLNRLTGRTTSGSLNSTHPALTWNMDAVGNRTSTVLNGTTTTYALNSDQLNHYATVGGSSLTWDTRGNLLTDGTRTLTYDADNRLATAAVTGTTATYTYDFAHRLARRIQSGGSEIRYLYDQNWNVIATISGSSGAILQKWIHGPAVDEVVAQIGSTSSNTYFLTKDHLGSTTALIRASTNSVAERYTYDEYGTPQVWNMYNQPVSTTPLTRYLFTGREFDNTVGLYHYRHRWYHPGIGRFVQPDPIGFAGGDVNWYGYVKNSNRGIIDPWGLSPSWQLPPQWGQDQEFDSGFRQGVSESAAVCGTVMVLWWGAVYLGQYAAISQAGPVIHSAMAAGRAGAIAGASGSIAGDAMEGNSPSPSSAIDSANKGAFGGICAFGFSKFGNTWKKVVDAISRALP